MRKVITVAERRTATAGSSRSTAILGRSLAYPLLQLLLLLIHTTSIASATSTSVASQFKAPNQNTPTELAATWRQKDTELWSYVESHVPAVLDHTGTSAFDEHLKGVQSVLRGWDAPEYLAAAGLFHSIYGTEGFQGFSIPLSERHVIQELIGPKAEKLCFVFCMVDRLTLDQTLWEWEKEPESKDASSKRFQLRARPELGRFTMELDKEEWLDFVELTLADWLEQVEGAASKPSDIFFWKTGEAYAYRRNAYRKMRDILVAERPSRLSRVVPEMHKAVYATEGEETRHLVQLRTPPMSKAAQNAFHALRANGEAIPEDLAPQPMDEPEKNVGEAEACQAS